VITYKNDNSLFSVIRIKQCFVDHQIDNLDYSGIVDIKNVGYYFDSSYIFLLTWFEVSYWHKGTKFRLLNDKKLFQKFSEFQEMEKLYPGVKYITYVVNPWYRVLANYFVFCQNNKDISFEDFVCGLEPQKNQIDWIKSGDKSVDFIVRLEHVCEDFQPVLDYFELENSFPYTFYDPTDYRRYYTKKSREVMESIFHKDCTELGYSFNMIG
jgi:hypothetical protein